jgi:hypothetical protein
VCSHAPLTPLAVSHPLPQPNSPRNSSARIHTLAGNLLNCPSGVRSKKSQRLLLRTAAAATVAIFVTFAHMHMRRSVHTVRRALAGIHLARLDRKASPRKLRENEFLILQKMKKSGVLVCKKKQVIEASRRQEDVLQCATTLLNQFIEFHSRNLMRRSSRRRACSESHAQGSPSRAHIVALNQEKLEKHKRKQKK